MNNKLIAALVCLGMTGAAGAADVDFDKGTDVSKLIEQAVTLDMPYPGPVGYDHNPGQWDNGNFHNYPGQSPHHIRYSRDCHDFSFGPSAGSLMSDRVRLESVEYIQECHYVPDPPPPPKPGHPGHPGQPGHPGHHPKLDEKGMQCMERPHDVFRRTVQLSMAPRQLLPWENDVFQVCIEGPRVDIRTREAAYSYDIREAGQYDIRYELSPGYKIPTAPDRNGLSAGALSYADGKFTFKVNERWAQEYAGEKVAIKVELYKDGFLFFNSLKGEKEFTFDTANGYELNFTEAELDKSHVVQPADPFPLYRGPKKYYLHWSFRRLGSVSTGEKIKKDSTDKIEVK